MEKVKGIDADSAMGRCRTDETGSAVGVARMHAADSYAGIGELLQEHIDQSSESAWRKIRAKIDYTYDALDLALAPLDAETRFHREIETRLARGQKLLLKPNLVNAANIDHQTHGPTRASTTCTEWPFVAALMRWFHDRLSINYHQMALGEAATCMTSLAAEYTRLNLHARPITAEAVIEGKSGDFYGGWGFYFVRRYLAESHPAGHRDDPMRGHDESVAGSYLPPGLAGDRLMVYDLNRLNDDPTRGREVSVDDGANFDSITLHKVVVGGVPEDAEDMRAYPGSILINVPKLKVHNVALLTGVIKNLGIGLYPMLSARAGGHAWDYSAPHNAVPGMKQPIPHQVWEPHIDQNTGLPRRKADGRYEVKKTAGLLGTMVDIIKAVASQDIFMMHVVDAVEMINLEHTGMLPGDKVPEGLVFAGLDPVATDLACARYMFSNVSSEEARKAGLDDGHGGRFPQRVPVPVVEGSNIVTRTGYDCPLARDALFQYAERRGLGQRRYYVIGGDARTGSPLASVKGRLGSVSDGRFSDIFATTLYYDIYKVQWDLQLTSLSYLEAVDTLAGSSLKKEFLEAFDDDGDGVVGYEDFGKTGALGAMIYLAGMAVSSMGTEDSGFLRGGFSLNTTMLRCSDPAWNPRGHDLFKELARGAHCWVAQMVSEVEMENQDPFLPSLTFGRGKWPSYQLASFVRTGLVIFGREYPNGVDPVSLYGLVLRHADLTQNDGKYLGHVRRQPDPAGVGRYFAAVERGEADPLDFVFYVPAGYGSVAGSHVPGIEETDDPEKLFTAVFGGGKEEWRGTV